MKIKEDTFKNQTDCIGNCRFAKQNIHTKPEKNKKRILFFGDSNTYGFDPRSRFGARYDPEFIWTNILAKKTDWEILPFGQNGRCIPSMEWEFRELEGILNENRRLDCFAVMLGTNDLLTMFNSNARGVAQRMEKLLKFILEALPACEKTKLLLIAPPPVKLFGEMDEERYNNTSKDLPAFYRALANGLGIEFADSGEWNIPLAFDGVHFSEKGHEVFAERIETVLAMILEDMMMC